MANSTSAKSPESPPSEEELTTARRAWQHHSANPYNWPESKKWSVIIIAAAVTFLIGMNATAPTTPSRAIAEQFHLNDATFPNSYWPVTVWNTAAAFGPMIGLPLLENFGIRNGFLFAADLWLADKDRNLPVTLYTYVYVAGVTLGPALGAVLSKQDTTVTKAANAIARPALPTLLYESLTRPARLLCTEPVVFSLTLWAAFCFGLVFIMTQSITQVYSTVYAFSDSSGGLVQISLFIGQTIGFLACLPQNAYYQRSAARNTAKPGTPIPEARLALSIPASLVGLAGGLFWYGWASLPLVHWILPTVGLAFVGFAIMVIITAVDLYINDAYTKYAGSAIAAVALGENLFAAWLPLAAKAMYTNLGFQWASSLLGFVALGLTLAPVGLIWKGETVRRKSRFIREASAE
ncbi:MAG: hypothetical protein Q9220_005169 [cf. Caloplaca sp. 1 TL-2023]